MNPLLRRLERAGFPIRRLDVDQNRETAEKYHITSIPAVISLCDGEEVGRIVGVTHEGAIRRLFKSGPNKLDLKAIGLNSKAAKSDCNSTSADACTAGSKCQSGKAAACAGKSKCGLAKGDGCVANAGRCSTKSSANSANCSCCAGDACKCSSAACNCATKSGRQLAKARGCAAGSRRCPASIVIPAAVSSEVLIRASYEVPHATAELLVSLMREQADTDFDATIEKDRLTITTTPQAQRVLGSFLRTWLKSGSQAENHSTASRDADCSCENCTCSECSCKNCSDSNCRCPDNRRAAVSPKRATQASHDEACQLLLYRRKLPKIAASTKSWIEEASEPFDIGVKAAGNRTNEKGADRWWRKYIMSEKARSIERKLGVDYSCEDCSCDDCSCDDCGPAACQCPDNRQTANPAEWVTPAQPDESSQLTIYRPELASIAASKKSWIEEVFEHERQSGFRGGSLTLRSTASSVKVPRLYFGRLFTR